MKKFAILTALCMVFTFSAALADTTHGKFDMAQRFEIGVDFGAYSPDSIVGNGTYLDSEFEWGGQLKYYFNTNFALGLRYHIWNHDEDIPTAGFYGDNKVSAIYNRNYDEFGRGGFDLDIDTFDITAYYYFSNPTNKKVRPFLGAGATHFSVDYGYRHDPLVAAANLITAGTTNAGTVWDSLSSGVVGAPALATHDWADFTVSGNTWGFHVLGGVEYWPNPDFSIRGEIKYVNADIDLNMARDLVGTAGSRVADDENLDLSGFYYGLGFTYHFDGPEQEAAAEKAEEDMTY